jgi:23S rRNA pseudouridine2457 synthase
MHSTHDASLWPVGIWLQFPTNSSFSSMWGHHRTHDYLVTHVEVGLMYSAGVPTTVLLHKPYGVLSRFTNDGSKHQPLASLHLPKDIYAVGRLDADSEGLLLLSNDPRVQHLGHASTHIDKVYWAQVEGVPSASSLHTLMSGVVLDHVMTKPALARIIDVHLPARDPPIRVRQHIKDTWLEITLQEGRNRQVRRMTAAVGHPTLRLMRVAIGPFSLGDLAAGQHRSPTTAEMDLLLALEAARTSTHAPRRSPPRRSHPQLRRS